jgi:RHS repeat-associated protein
MCVTIGGPMRLIRPVLSTVLLMSATCVPSALAQQTGSITPDIEEGMKPYGAFHGGDIDQVSLSSGKLDVNIPLASYPQRGKLKLSFWLRWQNPIAVARMICPGGSSCTYDNFFATNSSPGLVPTNPLLWTGGDKGAAPNGHGDYAELTAPDGSTRQMVWTGTAFETIDGSGMRFVPGSPGILEDQDAVRFFGGGIPNSIEDANGNYITPNSYGTTYVDTLGRTIPTPQLYSPTTDYSHCSGPIQPTSANLWTVPAPGGATETLKFCYAPFPVSYVISVDSHNVAGPGTTTMLESIVLPNNTTWTFQYGPTYPTLSQITLPTGGTISYTWNLFIAPCSYKSINNPRNGNIIDTQGWFFVLASRSVNANDGSGSHTWTYSGGPFAGSTTGGTVKITDPTLNDSVHVMTGLAGTAAVYETQAQFFQGSSSSGTLLKTVTTDYNWSPNPFYQPSVPTSCSTVVNVFPIRVTTAWANGQTTKQETDYDTSLKYGAYSGDSATITGSYGKPIASREYDYASGGPGALLRQTKTTYMAFSGPNSSSYLSNHLLSLPYTVQTLDGSGTQRAYTQYSYDQSSLAPSGVSTQHDSSPPAGAYRGNRTTLARWLNTTGGYLTTTSTYFDTGMLNVARDAASNPTTYTYSSTYVGAYPTTITNALNQNIAKGYDFNTGLLTNLTDANNQSATYSYDNMFRAVAVNFPDGGQTTICYTDEGGPTCPAGSAPFSAIISKKISPSQNLLATTLYDGLGRTSQTQLNSDPDGTTYNVTTYDALGRRYQTYNPTRCSTPTTNCGESTWGVTTNFYDALGRACLVVPPDGTLPSGNPCAAQPSNDVFTTYSGNTVTVTDQASHSHKSVTDALGRLTQVFEDPAGLNYETDYSYDALDNLLSANQKGGTTNSALWRTRMFAYDSLSRLISATNPESGTATYAYDPNGNLLSKTSPAPNQTGTATVTLSYCYDLLNRLTSKAYTSQSCPMSSPVATYSYDQTSFNGLTIANGIGRRTGMTDQAGSEAWSYDTMGRILSDRRTTNGVTKSFPYTYNLDGSMASDYSITYTQGGAGRYTSAGNSGYGLAYNVNYAPTGSMCHMNASWGNTFTHFWTYNNRLQPVGIQLYGTGHGSSSGTCILSTDTTADNVDLRYSFTDANGHNSGNVASITNVSGGGYAEDAQNFAYDSLNRIASAQTSAINQPDFQGDVGYMQECWAEQYSYDPWGNLLSIAPSSSSNYTGCSQESGFNLNGAIANNNRIVAAGYQYDSAGNLIAAPPTGTIYTFDAENHLVSAGGQTYFYDGDGKRVEKASGSPLVINKMYWYGNSSAPLQETDSAGNFQFAYFYFNGILVGRQESNNWVDHYGLDALGNVRFVYGLNGANDFSDYYPFGGERIRQSQTNNNRKFTGKERDSESGLDNFAARYFVSSAGRFMSPDDGPGQHTSNPQSWNLYSYVENNPLNSIDPTGHSTHTAANGEVLAVYDDEDLGVYQHTDIDNRKDWDGSKLDWDDEGSNYMGETKRWGEFANWNNKHPFGISGSAAPGAFIHFGRTIDALVDILNGEANRMGLTQTAFQSMHYGDFDIKTQAWADHGSNTGYLLNGEYVTIRSAGNYLAGLNAMTATFAGDHLSPQFAQKLFGAYQQGGGQGLAYTLTTGKNYPGTSAPYWGEEPYSGFMQQEGINAGTQKRQ